MLKLTDIKKVYKSGDIEVEALKGVDIEFRDNEFVSILGPSGCGKTTLLNIIGGLDKYSGGDLCIRGISTKRYKNADWDAYRNHCIGFVFQSYNLIPHQTVLANVELALTLSGVSRKERKKRAKEALIKVGLGDQMKKKPNQMSGGQMQRVAIARALVNNPDILLADEPTGALDTETSVQIMDILAEVAKTRLVIMVTHNPELAQTYATRIIKLLDGKVIADSMPIDDGSAASIPYMMSEKMPDTWASAGAGKKTVPTGQVQEQAAPVLQEEVDISTLSPKDAKKYLKEKSKQDKIKNKQLEKEEKQREKDEKKRLKQLRPKHTSMKLRTALSLSLNNLMTKKGRTFLTAFAGSIGIIGIALILSMSNGVQLYIDKVQEDTLSSYPLSIQKQNVDITSFLSVMQDQSLEVTEHNDDRIYTNSIMTGFMDMLFKEVTTNNLASFKEYIDNNRSKFDGLVSDIQYSYSTPLTVFRADTDKGLCQVHPDNLYDTMGITGMMGGGQSAGMGSMGAMGSMDMTGSSDVWTRLLDNDELIKKQYELVSGKFPENKDEVVLIVSDNQEVTDYTLYSLGILDSNDLTEAFKAVMRGEEANFPEPKSYSFDEILDLEFRLLTNPMVYEKQNDIWVDRSTDEEYMKKVVDSGLLIKVVGIIKPSSDAALSSKLNGRIGYRSSLMEYLVDEVNNTEIVKAQMANPDVDIFTGIPFDSDESDEISFTMQDLEGYIMALPEDQRNEVISSIESMRVMGMDDDAIIEAFSQYMTKQTTDATYDGNLSILGVADIAEPSMINIFPIDFESKDKIAEIIDEYNNEKPEEERISYTDYVGLIMSSVTTIINAISYILIAFVAVSLVVSSIMIGIITNISVLERTKEIGVLRAIGASKKDIARVFNAETLIVGFSAGLLGILVTELLLLPINAIIYYFTDIDNIAQLPPVAAVILVAISMFLTLIAGLFPSRSAARKDPVVALRSE